MTPTNENEIQRSLGQIEGKLDELLRRAAAHDEFRDSIMLRVGVLESWRSHVNGFVALLSLLLGFAFALILKTIPI